MLHSLKHQLSTYCVQGCTTILEGDEVTGLHATQQLQGTGRTQSPTSEPPLCPDPSMRIGAGVGTAESVHFTPSLWESRGQSWSLSKPMLRQSADSLSLGGGNMVIFFYVQGFCFFIFQFTENTFVLLL